MTTNSNASLTPAAIGALVGAAIARDVLADRELPAEWAGIDPQDGDQLTAAGIAPGSPEWAAAETAAEAAYYEAVLLVCGCQVQYDHSGGQGPLLARPCGPRHPLTHPRGD